MRPPAESLHCPVAWEGSSSGHGSECARSEAKGIFFQVIDDRPDSVPGPADAALECMVCMQRFMLG